ncbi:DUF4244 domain-containing protein [Microbispora sp. H10836]|uniref:DUF4244 domain-containing protein n=1 Tax=Microbispora sp. H10836 TaxID=2729106 RepID=UPI0020169EF1|nr:DUF4244 domain-containing protein [Microbispora sp. H10836]
MSKHAATGRRKQTGTQAGTSTGTVLQRRAGGAGGRHRARPARWAALARAVRRALSSRSGRVSVFARSCRWAGSGGSQGRRSSMRLIRGAVRVASVVQMVCHGPRRSCAALRRSAARISCRAQELSIQWTVRAGTRAEAGMSTAEYAVGTIAACGFAALLWKVVTSAEVRSMLAALIQKALKLAA